MRQQDAKKGQSTEHDSTQPVSKGRIQQRIKEQDNIYVMKIDQNTVIDIAESYDDAQYYPEMRAANTPG